MSLSNTATEAAETKNKLALREADTFADNREAAVKGVETAIVADAHGEVAEFIDGNISENIAEDRHQASEPSKQSSDQTAQDSSQATNYKLEDVNVPAPKVVVRKVKTALQQEIKQVERDVKKLQRRPMQNAHALTKALNVLQQLRVLLTGLAQKSWEQLKRLWLQIYNKKTISETL